MLTLIGLGKDDDHCWFRFAKSNGLEELRSFLHAFGFEQSETTELLEPMGTLEQNYEARPYSNALYTDLYFTFKDPIFVELFFGKEIIMLSVHNADQEKVQEEINKISSF